MIDRLQEPTMRAEARASWTPSVAAWPTTPPPGRRSVPRREEPATRVKVRRLLGSVVDAHLQGRPPPPPPPPVLSRHHQRVPRSRARAAVPEPLHARREPAHRRQLRVGRRRHPQ
ncbi:hypothetical protein ACQJBY_067654 [Aegilops geniculata]